VVKMLKDLFRILLVIFTAQSSLCIVDIYDTCLDKCIAITIDVLFNYFKDQHFMTVVEVSKDSDFHSMDTYACLGGNNLRPVDVFNTLDVDFGPIIGSSSVSSYPTTHGYSFRSVSPKSMEEFFEKLSSHNPRSKLLFMSFDSDFEVTKGTIKIGYEKYKMLDVAGMVFVPEFHDDVFVGLQVHLCLYNPFAGSSEVRSPEFKCLEFNSSNINEKSIEMENFQQERIENLHQFPLNVNIFEYEMKSVAVKDKEGKLSLYTYPDGELLNSIAKVMNFKVNYASPIYGPKYGYQIANGTFTGGLAASEYGQVDLVANPKLIADYNTTNSIFLQPVAMTKLYFIIQKRATSRKLIVTVFTELDYTSKVFAFSTIITFLVVYFILNRMENQIFTKVVKFDPEKDILYIFALIHNVSMKHPKLPATRTVVMPVLIFSLLLTALFQGIIVKNLNTDVKIGKITKINQLLEQNFEMKMQTVLSYAFQGYGDDKITKHLNEISKDREEVAMQYHEALKIMQNDSKFAYLWTDSYIGTFLDKFYDNKTGKNYLEVVPESAFEFYIAMMVPKNSPFFDRFNQIINIYVQTGLYQYHTQKASDDNQKIWIHRVKNGQVPNREKQALKLDELQDVFKLYLALIALSFFVFCLKLLSSS
jgi:hypothetical protein